MSNSKDLLHLEADASSLESKLLFCNRNDGFQSQNLAPNPPDKKPHISSVPQSQFLSKIKDFLGVFAEDNNKLELAAKNNPEKYDIETLTGEESEYIEMDLMLGVAELKTQEAVSAAESAIASYQPVINLAASNSETESEDSRDEDDDDDDDEDNMHDSTSKSADDGTCSVGKSKRSKPKESDSSRKAPKRKRQSGKRPNIVELP